MTTETESPLGLSSTAGLGPVTGARNDMEHIDILGAAISDAGITWTPEMRSAWDKAKDRAVACQKVVEAADAIFVALKNGHEAAMVLDENSPIMDALRDAMRAINATAVQPEASRA